MRRIIIFKNRFLFRKSCAVNESQFVWKLFCYFLPKVFLLCVQTSEVERRRRLNLHFLFNFPSGQNCNALAYQITFLRPSENLWRPVIWKPLRYIIPGSFCSIFGGGSLDIDEFLRGCKLAKILQQSTYTTAPQGIHITVAIFTLKI